MNYKEKCEAFDSKTGRDIFMDKTPLDDLPIEMGYGSSTHHPERKGGITTCDIVFWIKAFGSDWFRPYGNFHREQVEKMVEICNNDQQVISLFELLSAKKG